MSWASELGIKRASGRSLGRCSEDWVAGTSECGFPLACWERDDANGGWLSDGALAERQIEAGRLRRPLRLRTLQPDALFVWGCRDRLVPIAFARHVADALPRARHRELDCGHVPQVERPKQTHAALAAFLFEVAAEATGAKSRQGR